MSDALRQPAFQVGYLVEDLKVGMQSWIDHMGVGPWTEFRNSTLTGTFDGEPVEVVIHAAMAYHNDLQIELIEVVSTDPCPYLNPDGSRVLGQHHLGWLTEDLDAALASATARGMQPRLIAGNHSTKVAYLSSPNFPGAYFELIENPAMPAMVEAGLAATRDWDGTNPIKTIDVGG